MIKWFRKHSKWIMAIFGGLLMIAFTAMNSNQRGSGQQADPGANVVATVYGNQSITARDSEIATSEVDLLRSQIFLIPPPSEQEARPVPVLEVLQAPAFAISRQPEIFLMLLQEARHLSIQPSNDYLQSILSNVSGIPTEAQDPLGYNAAQQAIYDLATVRALLDRVGDMVKISQPLLEHVVATELQRVSVRLVEYSIKNYPPPTSRPTDNAVQAQYDAHKDELANVPTPANPMGFGYKYPNRVQLQYIGFLQSDLTKTVVASKLPYQWTTEARRYFRQHPDEFPASTTNPSTNPTTAPVTWETLPDSTRQDVYKIVHDQAAADLAQQINKEISEQMAEDNTAYHAAIAAQQTPGNTRFGCPYTSDAYLPALADSVEKDLGVRPRVELLPTWQSADNLKLLAEIGISSDLTNPMAPRPFSDYATTAGIPQGDKSPELALWQPSQPMTVEDGSGTFFFRLTNVDPSHPAPLADVRDQVINDLRTIASYQSMKMDADQFTQMARDQRGIDRALDPPSPITTTGLFALNTAQDPMENLIPGYSASDASLAAIRQGAIHALASKATGKPPIEEVELPMDRRIAVIELMQVHPDWPDTGQQIIATGEVFDQIHRGALQNVEANWAQKDLLIARTEYQATKK